MFLNNGMVYNPKSIKLTKIQIFLSKFNLYKPDYKLNFRKTCKGIEKDER